jgi:hypothetical protein
VKLRALDFFEQHGRNHGLPVLGLERQAGHHVRFCCEQVNGRAYVARGRMPISLLSVGVIGKAYSPSRTARARG